MEEATMRPIAAGTRPEWNAEDLRNDPSWLFELTAAEARDLIGATRHAYRAGRPLLDYRREEFDLGRAMPKLIAAFEEQRSGRGVALLRGLPREGVSETEFELMTWAIGLHFGVARPQGKQTHYVSRVANAGNAYRTGTGRGYNSNADLDFHTDTSDIVLLACYNAAKAGGMSMCTSTLAAHNRMAEERPDLAERLHDTYCFSRQGEQAADEGAFLTCPVVAVQDGRVFGRWNRNRLKHAQGLPGVPELTPKQAKALDLLDAMLRREDLMFSMWLQPGDLQLMNNHAAVHSRTEFEDHEDPAKRRLLFRLWLAPPDSYRLPEGFRDAFKRVEPGTVRGGFIGQNYTEDCSEFEARQAASLGMRA
jgi:alpha-ketoglutarate-dependent taurine dioxygenase